MTRWQTTDNNASIVLIGEFTPEQFHPMWFIHNKIVGEWEYMKEEHMLLPEFMQFDLPPGCKTTITTNNFSIQTSLESDFLTMKDIVAASLQQCSNLSIKQIGINYTETLHIDSLNDWRFLGKQLAPHENWQKAAPYIANLDEEKQLSLGLTGLQMQLPRQDDLSGYIYAQINVISPRERTFLFNVNHHFEIHGEQVAKVQRILEGHWDSSIRSAKELINCMMANFMESE